MNDATRREIIAGAGALVTVSVVGCIGDDDNNDDDEVRTPEEVAVDWVSPADNVDDEGDIVDMTDEDSVQVDHGEIGVDGNYISEPGIIRVTPGTEITYVWVSPGHSLTEVEGQGETISDWEDNDDDVEGEGFEHTTSFEDTGVALWECIPHRADNHRGAVIVE